MRRARASSRRAQAAADGKPEAYHDFRKVLDRKDIDAVVIATPDHWHAIPTILACQAGKDVYCEKPLTHRIAEGRAVVKAVEKYGRVTQMGNLIHAGENYHRVVEIVRSGALGTISKTRVWMAADRSGLGKPADCSPPAGCDYDFWLGPAPKRPFNPNRFTFNWRWFWDYGGGILTDFCCHIVDLVHWAMDVDAPQTIAATGGRFALDDNAETPDTLEVVYEYEKAGRDFLMVWSQTDANAHGLENMGLGIMFQGTEATLVADYGTYKIIPEKGKTIPEVAKTLAPLGRPPSRVAERHQVTFPVLVQLRLRPPAQLRRPPGKHRALDRRKTEVGRRQRAGSPTIPRPTGFSPRVTASPGCCPPSDTQRDFRSSSHEPLSNLVRRGCVCLLLAIATAHADEPRWKQHTINGQSEFEAAGVFDVDRDGKLDIVCGDTWYQAPDWKPHHIRDVQRMGTYYNDFATLPLDVNGDGHTDFITVSYFGKNVGWVENPGRRAPWAYHEVDVPGTSEAAASVDLTGDGIPDVLPNPTNVVAWYEVANEEGRWQGFRDQEARFRHRGRRPRRRLGRCQRRRPRRPAHAQGLVRGPRRSRQRMPRGPGTPTGTWAPRASRSWPATSTATACPTWSMAWATTTACLWMKQGKSAPASAPGPRGRSTLRSPRCTPCCGPTSTATAKPTSWSPASASTPTRSSRGDRRLARRLVSLRSPGQGLGQARDLPGRAGQERTRRRPPIAWPSKTFPPGTAGTGLQLTAIDIDGDGDLDLVCPGKSGLYLFENLGARSNRQLIRRIRGWFGPRARTARRSRSARSSRHRAP